MDLNVTWFLLFGVLIAVYAMLDGFDLGAGVISLLSRREDHRKTCANAIAPVWDGNEVWLITAGASLFAAFPPVYATVFSGFYLAFLLLLLALIVRAVSIEYRNVVDSPRWRRAWDWGFGIGSLLPSILFGVAVGNVMRGLPIDAAGDFRGTFLGLLNPYSVLFGLLSLAMFVLHGAIWLAMKTDGDLAARAAAFARLAWVAWIVLWLGATAATAFAAPDLFAAGTGRVASWAAAAVLVAALALVRVFIASGAWGRAFAASSAAIAAAVGLVGAALFPRLP
ncbi:MAG: cytochrome d ubiquinol oxidase subunit II, partial [Deltaproteobacteria bacterium]|nr:cytochrome d ubiquinol oxidase subunit II [Deltaproteobacteria bacterium]